MRGHKQINQFSAEMLENLNLPKNTAKGPWQNMRMRKILWLHLLEYFELVLAVVDLRFTEWRYRRGRCGRLELWKAKERVLSEAADCGVLAMFAADVSGAMDD